MHLEYDERDENRIIRGGVLWQTLKSIWDFWIKHSLGQGKSFVQEQGGFRLQKIQAAATARVFAGSGLVLLNEMAVTFCYNCFLLIESIICIIKSSVNNNWVCFLFRLQWCLHFMQHFWTFQLTLQWCVPNHSSHRAAPERRACLACRNEEHAENMDTSGSTKRAGFQNNPWTQAHLLFCSFQISVYS